MQLFSCPFMMAISVLSIFLGIFLFLKSELAIKIQIKFYEKINWRMEPISMVKEVKNTKFMGLLLLVIALIAIAIILKKAKMACGLHYMAR